MSWWPFRKDRSKQEEAAPEAQISTLDRMVQRNCGQDEFFLLYSKLLEERFLVTNLQFVERDLLSFQKPGGGEMHTYLQNLWIAYSRNPESRAEVIEQYLRGLGSAIAPKQETTREQIIPLIKDSEYLAALDDKAVVISEHLAGDLFIVYAVDWPDHTASLSQSEFEKLGLSMGELRQLAVGNLKGLLPGIECHGDGRSYLMATAGGNYEASTLLLDSFWDQVREDVDGDLVATVPARDVLLFTGSGSAEGLKKMRERAMKIVSTGDHVVSTTLLRRTNGIWVVFD